MPLNLSLPQVLPLLPLPFPEPSPPTASTIPSVSASAIVVLTPLSCHLHTLRITQR